MRNGSSNKSTNVITFTSSGSAPSGGELVHLMLRVAPHLATNKMLRAPKTWKINIAFTHTNTHGPFVRTRRLPDIVLCCDGDDARRGGATPAFRVFCSLWKFCLLSNEEKKLAGWISNGEISKFISVNVLVRVWQTSYTLTAQRVYIFIFIAVNFQFQLSESIHGIQIALTANNRSVCRMCLWLCVCECVHIHIVCSYAEGARVSTEQRAASSEHLCAHAACQHCVLARCVYLVIP